MKTSIKQISETTGFSASTVSNALNHKKGVNKETAATILKVAKDLGYIAEEKISRIKIVIYRRSGSVIEDSPFFAHVMDGAESECQSSGLDLVACNLDKRHSDYHDQIKWLLNDTTSGIIILGSELEESDLDLYRSCKCPILLIDYWCNDMTFNGILSNNGDSTRLAIEYFIKKGHKKIGYLRGRLRIYPFRSRGNAFRNTMLEHNLPINTKHIVTVASSIDGSYHDMKLFLKTMPELPTAYFADNDCIALGVMKALQEFGYKIPEDISIIGFDDLPFCEITSPKLTTIRTVKKELGRMAVQKIMDMVKNGDDTQSIVLLSTTFVERDSVRDLTKK